jgi:DNA-binding protein YbaB
MTNIQQLMQMGQQLQARMAQLQEELSAREISASSGGGMVTATVDGKGTLTRISGIANIESSFALGQVKHSNALPIAER